MMHDTATSPGVRDEIRSQLRLGRMHASVKAAWAAKTRWRASCSWSATYAFED